MASSRRSPPRAATMATPVSVTSVRLARCAAGHSMRAMASTVWTWSTFMWLQMRPVCVFRRGSATMLAFFGFRAGAQTACRPQPRVPYPLAHAGGQHLAARGALGRHSSCKSPGAPTFGRRVAAVPSPGAAAGGALATTPERRPSDAGRPRPAAFVRGHAAGAGQAHHAGHQRDGRVQGGDEAGLLRRRERVLPQGAQEHLQRLALRDGAPRAAPRPRHRPPGGRRPIDARRPLDPPRARARRPRVARRSTTGGGAGTTGTCPRRSGATDARG